MEKEVNLPRIRCRRTARITEGRNSTIFQTCKNRKQNHGEQSTTYPRFPLRCLRTDVPLIIWQSRPKPSERAGTTDPTKVAESEGEQNSKFGAGISSNKKDAPTRTGKMQKHRTGRRNCVQSKGKTNQDLTKSNTLADESRLRSYLNRTNKPARSPS